MQITFDTAEITEAEANGLIALLASVCPDALSYLPAPGAAHAPPPRTGPAPVPYLNEPLDFGPIETYEEEEAPADAPVSTDPVAAFAPPAPEAFGGPQPPPSATVAAPPPSAPTAPLAAELDAEGLPWDERIHAGTKNKTQKNVWKAKKGVDDATKAAVTAELRATYPLPSGATAASLSPPPPPATAPPAPPAAPPATPPAGAPTPTAAAPASGSSQIAPSPAAPPPSTPTSAAPGATMAEGMGVVVQNFPNFMRRVKELQDAGTLTTADITTVVLPAIGLTELRQLAARGDLIASAFDQIEALASAA